MIKDPRTKKRPGAIIIEGHVQGLSNTRSLGEIGVPVIVVDKNNCVARYSRYCSAFYKCPQFESDELAEFLVALAKREQLGGWVLIPSNDHAVLTLSRNKERLEDFYKVITPGMDVIENIYDKSRLLAIAEKVNVPVARTCYLESAGRPEIGLEFPVVTKGRQGLDFYRATGQKAFVAGDHQELGKQLKEIGEVFPIERTFTQELIPFDGENRTISFAAFCEQGKIKTFWIGEKVREHPIRFGTATCARSIICEDLIAPTRRLLDKLNYTGVCEVEYLKDPRDGKYKLIEINARTWLWVGLAKACGVNFAADIYLFMMDEKVVPSKGYAEGVVWINYLTDIPYALLALVKGELRFREYFETIRRKRADALVSVRDLKPLIAYFVLGLTFLRKR